MISDFGRKLFAAPLASLVPLLQKIGVTPNGLTVIGFLLTIAAALFLAAGSFLIGGLILLIAALFDMLDGSLARATGQSTKFGAFFDSSIDRYSESVILVALIYYYSAASSRPLEPVLLAITLVGSLMVSYTRARAEALGVECKVGLLQRPERVILLIVGLLAGSIWPIIMTIILSLLAILTNVTALQRIYEVHRLIGDEPLDSTDSAPAKPIPAANSSGTSSDSDQNLAP